MVPDPAIPNDGSSADSSTSAGANQRPHNTQPNISQAPASPSTPIPDLSPLPSPPASPLQLGRERQTQAPSQTQSPVSTGAQRDQPDSDESVALPPDASLAIRPVDLSQTRTQPTPAPPIIFSPAPTATQGDALTPERSSPESPQATVGNSAAVVLDGAEPNHEVVPALPPVTPRFAPTVPNKWNTATGWTLYFPDSAENDPVCAGRARVVSLLKQFFLSDEGYRHLTSIPIDSCALLLDYRKMICVAAPSVLKNIAKALLNDPGMALASIGLAACRAFEDFAISRPEIIPNSDAPVMGQKLVARILNFEPFTAMRDLKGMTVGSFVAVRGTIVRVSTIRQQLVSMHFQCTRCSETQVVTFQDYKYSNPSSCPTDRCRSRTFSPLRETAETVDWQRIRVQEIQQRDSDPTTVEEGRIPRTIDAELFADLIDSCVPGDIATVCGVVKVMTVEGASQAKNTNSLYYMYVEANSISTTRSRSSASTLNSGQTDRIVSDDSGTPTVHSVIHEVVREEDPFGFLVHSAVPTIYGHEMVKAGLLLALFGGSSKVDSILEATQNSDCIAIRSDIHCLVVGDPGLGKSQMLKAFCNIAPRGVYVCGNTSSTAGLTVTVVRESTGDFALEAGALVLGDGGICCIDEFDKMGAEHGALLEAMEQQSVSVAKAGLLCNLSARTTVLAAANPVGGHYDRSKTVCENLKIALPLLSRFDLVYILMDKADEARDRFISRHVMQTFGTRNRGNQRSRDGGWRNADRAIDRGSRSVADAAAEAAAATQAQAMARDALNGTSSQQNLEMRLRNMRVRDPLPPQLFREYIAYAREHVHPTLTDGAKRVLQSFYLELRKAAYEKTSDTTPVTTRQLESMIRLSEARTRAVMRTVVTANDARDVVEILRTCMVAEVTDEFGTVDLDRTSGMSGASAKFKFVKRLQVEARRTGNKTFSTSNMKSIAKDMGIQGMNFSKMLDSINSLGFILKKGSNTWSLANVDAD